MQPDLFPAEREREARRQAVGRELIAGVVLVGRGKGVHRELLAVAEPHAFLGISVKHCGHPTALRPWYIDTYPQWQGPAPAMRAYQHQADAVAELAAVVAQRDQKDYSHTPTGVHAMSDAADWRLE